MPIAIPNDFEQFMAEIEYEYKKRFDDYSILENHIKMTWKKDNEELARMLMNTLIVMIYSFYEGFCKCLFDIYINYINKTEVNVGSLEIALAASSLSDDFKRLEDTHYVPGHPHIDFRKNGKLLRFARRIEFTSKYSIMMDKAVNLPEGLTNTESNLNIEVLERIMYTLGLDYSFLEGKRGPINMIVNRRNDAAHGTFDRTMSDEEFNKYKQAVISTVEMIKQEVIDSYRERKYMKTA